MALPPQNSPEKLPPGPLPHNTNRRFSPRIRAPFWVKAVERDVQLRGVDLSFGGLMVTCTEPIWAGTTLDLSLTLLKDNAPTTVQARVVELTTFRNRMAARMVFVSPSPTVLEQIALWMARLSK